MEKKRSTLIVIRGCPAAGKSTTAKKLQKVLLKKKKSVNYFSWDTFLHFTEPVPSLTKKNITNTTKAMCYLAKLSLALQRTDFCILDGVFLMPQEIKEIQKISRNFCECYFFHLTCSRDTLLARNVARKKSDFLPSKRIETLKRSRYWNKWLKNDISINNEEKSVHAVCESILKIIL